MTVTDMFYRPLGKCGTRVSVISLGGWITYGGLIKDQKAVKKILYTAHDGGINYFDIADVYANGEAEKLMGNVLRDFPRHTLVIASKVYFPFSDDVNDQGLSRKHIMESVEKSLKRIGTDYLDIYFCHRFDEHTPVEETVRTMDDLVHQGKILYWGTSEWNGTQIREVHHVCARKNYYHPQVEQPRYNLLDRRRMEAEIIPEARRNGMGLVVFSPLASGLLTGKYDEGIPENSRLAKEAWIKEWVYRNQFLEAVRRFKQVAEQTGYSRTQLALAWAIQQPDISSVIIGASNVEQLKENLSALQVNWTPEIQKALEDIFPPDFEEYPK